jgi:hypothetical protein
MIASTRQALSEPVQAKLWEEGQAMTLKQATEYALSNSPDPMRARNGLCARSRP